MANQFLWKRASTASPFQPQRQPHRWRSRSPTQTCNRCIHHQARPRSIDWEATRRRAARRCGLDIHPRCPRELQRRLGGARQRPAARIGPCRRVAARICHSRGHSGCGRFVVRAPTNCRCRAARWRSRVSGTHSPSLSCDLAGARHDPVGERTVGVPVAIGVALVVAVLLTGLAGLIVIAAAFAIGGPMLGRSVRTSCHDRRPCTARDRRLDRRDGWNPGVDDRPSELADRSDALCTRRRDHLGRRIRPPRPGSVAHERPFDEQPREHAGSNRAEDRESEERREVAAEWLGNRACAESRSSVAGATGTCRTP